MKSKVWKNRLGLLCLILTILTIAITLTINAYPLYAWEIGHLEILDWIDLSKKELLMNYRELMRYLNTPWVSKLVLPDFPVSESGAFHFYEVKKLFLLNYGVLLVTIIPSIIYVKNLVQTKSLWKIIRPFQFGALVPVVLGFLMFIGFDQFFIGFHNIFFQNDAWIFDPKTDPIIDALPQEYFMHCFILAIVLLEAFFLLGIFLGKRQLRKTLKNN